VEDKLNFSPASISQIVDELGFSDESHLSRQFKKYSGYSPVQYRNKKRHGSESLL
jgi:AraC-like DNA-binding protein